MAYRLYVSDALYYSQRGVNMPWRYMDLLKEKTPEEKAVAPAETGEQTIDRIAKKLRGETA